MKKNIYNILVFGVLILAASLLASCALHFDKREDADDNKITKTYDITTPFKGIDTKTSVEIIYTISDSITVKAEGSETYVNKLQITVGEDSILYISRASDKNEQYDKDEKSNKKIVLNITPDEPRDNIKLYISGPSINSLTIAGSAKFNTEDVLKPELFAMSISGAAEMEINGIETSDFKTVSKGASEIDIKSLKAETVYFETAGAGEIKSKLVDVKKTTLSGKGASEVELEFENCDEASIELAGAGEVTLSGSLHKLNKHIAGAGSINYDNLKIK